MTLINTFDNIKYVIAPHHLERRKIARAFGKGGLHHRKLKQRNAEMESHRKILTNEVAILNPMRTNISKTLLLVFFVLLEVSFEVIDL
jgi:hypothetical protein